VMDDKQRIALVETRTLDTVGDDPAPRQLIRYQFGNHLGSASLELDDQAQIISYEEYSPYGNSTYQAVRSQTETAKRYRYTGKERDSETGFHFHGARYYATWLGKWLSCDPLGLVDGLSLFTYVSCNPVRLNDPTGRQQAALCNIDPQHPAAVVCTPVQEKAADEVLEVTVHGPKRGSKEREAELKEMQGSAKSGTPSPPVNVPTPVKGGNDGIPLWMAWQRPDFWSGQVDPRAINDFNEGVNRNAVPLVGALTLGALQLGILGGLEYGGGALVFSRNFASALGNYTGVTPLVNGVRVAADILTSSSGGIGFGTRLWLAMNMGTAEAMGWGALGGGALAASGGGGSSGGGSSSQGYMPSHQRVPAITYGSYQDRGGLDISVPRTIYVVDGKAYYVTSGQAMRLPGQLDKGTGNAFRIWGIQESTDGPIKAGWVGKQTILGGELSPAPSAAQNSVVLDFHGNLSNPADVNAWLRQQGVDAQGSIPNQWQF
jgi:RHS repeat-associated protein